MVSIFIFAFDDICQFFGLLLINLNNFVTNEKYIDPILNVAFLFFSGVYAFGFLFMLPQLFVNYKVSIYHIIHDNLFLKMSK